MACNWLGEDANFKLLFLFAGKTTLLRHVLENSTLKIGCIVNDVANVNIDAKLIRNDRNRDRSKEKNTTADLADTIELANGCACTPCFLPQRGSLLKLCALLVQPIARPSLCLWF